MILNVMTFNKPCNVTLENRTGKGFSCFHNHLINRKGLELWLQLSLILGLVLWKCLGNKNDGCETLDS